MPLLRVIKEKVYTKDLDGDGVADIPDDRKGETGAPEVDMDAGLTDTNNDGQTDTQADADEKTDIPDDNKGETDAAEDGWPEEEEEGDKEIADELAALEEDDSSGLIKLKVQNPFHDEPLEEGKIDNDAWSKFKPWGKEVRDFVYYAPQDNTPPLQQGMVRLAAQISQKGIGKTVRGKHKVRHWERNMVTLHVSQPGFKVHARDPEGMGGYDRSQTLPYGEGEVDFREIDIRVDAKYIEPADDGRFVDVANWVLKKKGITDRYGSLLDFNGKIIATKKAQKKFSNAGAISWDED